MSSLWLQLGLSACVCVFSQVSDFGRFSEAVTKLDLDLCETVEKLDSAQQQQLQVETRQQEIDMFLDQIEVNISVGMRLCGCC